MSISEINADEQAIAELAIANVRFGAQQEKERIIKLLEEKLVWIDYEGIGIKGGWTITPNQLIALIKEENQ